MTTFGVSLARVGRSAAGARIEAAGRAYQASLVPKKPTAWVMPDIPDPPPWHVSKCRYYAKAVAQRHNIKLDDILGKSRKKHIIKARREVFYVCVIRTGLSYQVIGMALGNKDHTTVQWSVMQHCDFYGLPMPRGMDEMMRKRKHEGMLRRMRKRYAAIAEAKNGQPAQV